MNIVAVRYFCSIKGAKRIECTELFKKICNFCTYSPFSLFLLLLRVNYVDEDDAYCQVYSF